MACWLFLLGGTIWPKGILSFCHSYYLGHWRKKWEVSSEHSQVTELDTPVGQGNVESLCSGKDGTLGTSFSLLTLLGLLLHLTWRHYPRPSVAHCETTRCLALIGKESWTLGSSSTVSYGILCSHSLHCQGLDPNPLLPEANFLQWRSTTLGWDKAAREPYIQLNFPRVTGSGNTLH